MDSVTVNGVKYVREDQVKTSSPKLSNRCIVRCKDAGVHVGTVKKKDGNIIELENSNRLWYWKSEKPRKALFTLSEVAMEGVCRKESKIGALVPKITLREWCEIIPVKEGIDLTEVNNGIK